MVWGSIDRVFARINEAGR